MQKEVIAALKEKGKPYCIIILKVLVSTKMLMVCTFLI